MPQFDNVLFVFLMNRIKMHPFKTQNVTAYSAALAAIKLENE